LHLGHIINFTSSGCRGAMDLVSAVYYKKFSLFFIFGIFLLVAPTSPALAVFQQDDSGSQGLISIEAEHYHANTSAAGHDWSPNSTAGFSGDGAMEATPNSGLNIKDNYAPLNSPRMDYDINFVTTGTHYVWVLGLGTHTGNDSIHIGLDNAEVATSKAVEQFPGTDWIWSNQRRDPAVPGGHLPATLEITSTGVKTLNAWMREDGFIFDKIVITTDPAFVPTGTGPAESFQKGGASGAQANYIPIIVE